jgi:hypothetical protein
MGSPLEIANQQRRLPMISFINDPKELKGRRTLVTGGSRGIGGAIVKAGRPYFTGVSGVNWRPVRVR